MKKRNFLLCLLVTGVVVLLTACTFNVPGVGDVTIEVPSIDDILGDLGIGSTEASGYTVTFETNGGSEIAPVVTKDSIEEPEIPVKEGHNFIGWFKDEELTDAVDFANLEVSSDMTLYAKWEVQTYTVKFDTMGGSEVEEITVEYGNPVAIPANPTKEGYDFAGWYLKKDYSKVYANDLIKSNTTLYAKWRSALRYAGSAEGEGKYNPDGTYSFTVQLQLWGRVRIVYNGDLLSMDDEDLTVTGAFTSANQAPWTPELYCDVPDESSTEVDWTTLINSCANPVDYTFTYNPKDHSLDIQAKEILPAIPEVPAEGFYLEVYNNNKAFESGHKGTLEGGIYSGSVVLQQWWRVRAYYNGQPLSANVVNITGDFEGYNPKNKDLYIDLEWETEYDFLCDYASEGVEYTISYNPDTNTLDIQDDEPDAVVVIPSEGFAYEHTAADTTLMAPEVVELGEDGTYTIVIELAAWRYVVMYYNGVAIDAADETLSCTLSGGVYVDDLGAPTSRFYVNAIGKYQYVYNPTTHTLVAGKYVAPAEPDDGADFVWAVSSDEYAKVYTESGATVDTLSLWRLFIIVDGEGKIAYMCEMPKNGYGGIATDTYIRHSAYADYTTNPAYVDGKFVVPEGGFAIEAWQGADSTQKLMEEISGLSYVEHGVNTNSINVDTVRLAYDAAAGTVTVSRVEEINDSEGYEWLLSSDEYAKAYAAGSVVDVKALWRLYLIVDGEGRVAYICEMPKNGYGGYDSTTYARHSMYADYSKNPAIVNGGFVVPEGGFAIEAYTGTESVQELMKEITGLDYVQHGINSNAVNVDTARLVYDAATGTLTVSHVEEEVSTETVVTYGGTRSGDAVDKGDGSYEIIVDLATWNNISIILNGEVVSIDTLTVTGLYNPNEGADWTENLYWEGDHSKLFTCTGGKYVLLYNPTAATLNISLYSVNYGGTHSGVAVDKGDGSYEIIVDLATWNNISIILNGEVVSIDTLTVTGLYNPNEGADWTENLYWEGDHSKLFTCTGGKYVLLYNPTAATLNISLYVEPSNFVWEKASAEHTVEFTQSGASVETRAKWRTYLFVDAEGKIAYMCEMPINGYGGIDTNTYLRHSSYADSANNPAYANGGFVVPEGGFALEIWQGAPTVQELMEVISGVSYSEHGINTSSINVDNVRLSYNAETGVLTVTK